MQPQQTHVMGKAEDCCTGTQEQAPAGQGAGGGGGRGPGEGGR